MKIGFDLDGVFCSDSDTWLDKFMFKCIPNTWAFLRQRFKKLIWEPIGYDYVIITGRPFCDAAVTLWWLKKHGIIVPVYFAPPMDEMDLPDLVEDALNLVDVLECQDFFSRSVLHKVKKIADLDLDLFVESDQKQAKRIGQILNGVVRFDSKGARIFLEEKDKYEISNSSVWGSGQHHSVLVRPGIAQV